MNVEFEYDIFISYARIDNQTPGKGRDQVGWISWFHRTLDIRLAELTGVKPKIWRDDTTLRGHDYVNDEIIDQLGRTAILLSVLSPPYLESKWCSLEREEFIKAAEQDGGVRLDNKARIYKAIKTHIPLEKQPPIFQELRGYEFFDRDPESRHPHDFYRGFGLEVEPEYYLTLDDLAYDMRDLLKMIKQSQPAEPPPPSTGLAVYLAETAFDLRSQRNEVRRMLEDYGHPVLPAPDRPLPQYGPELIERVRENLARCCLSIHLIGKNYGLVPDEADRSAVELQNELAVERSRQQPNFSRLVWLPPDIEVTEIDHERQRAFVAALRDEPAALGRGTDLVRTPLEELKTVIRDKLRSLSEPDGKTPPTDKAPARIYLIYDQRDREEIEPLKNYLYDYNKEFVVLEPLFSDDEAEVSQEHRENLRLCDAALIYYGRANETWLRGKLRDLRKAPGYDRRTPIRARAVYVAGPENRRKAGYRNREVDAVIKNFDQFSGQALDPFLAKLEQRNGGQTR